MRKIYLILCFTALVTSCSKKEKIDLPEQKVVSGEKKASEILLDDSKEVLDGEYCFEKVLNKDSTRISLNVHNNEITGEMIWRPWQKDGAKGTLKGELNSDNEMDLVYNYMIEGVNQTETKIMKVKNGKLFLKTGELVDSKNDGNLSYKDKASAKYTDSLEAVSCGK